MLGIAAIENRSHIFNVAIGSLGGDPARNSLSDRGRSVVWLTNVSIYPIEQTFSSPLHPSS